MLPYQTDRFMLYFFYFDSGITSGLDRGGLWVFWRRRLKRASTFLRKKVRRWPGLRIFWPRNDLAALLRWRLQLMTRPQWPGNDLAAALTSWCRHWANGEKARGWGVSFLNFAMKIVHSGILFILHCTVNGLMWWEGLNIAVRELTSEVGFSPIASPHFNHCLTAN